MKQNHSISAFQSYALVVMTVVGVSILIIPRNVGQLVGADGTWIILISTLLTMLIVYGFTKLCLFYPNESFTRFTEYLLGSKRKPWVGKLLKIPFIVAFVFIWLAILAYVIRSFGEVVVSTIFENTPLEVVMVTVVGIAALVASSEIEVLAKFNELLFPFIFIPLIFLIISSIQKGELVHLLPLFQVDWKQVIKASINMIVDFAGYSVLLIFMANYQQPQKAIKIHSLAIMTIGILYLTTFVTTISVFGIYETEHLFWPSLETVRVIDLPFQIFQRLESLMIVLWMVASFTTVSNILSAFVELIREYFGLRKHCRKWISLILIPLIILLALVPKDISEIKYYVGIVGAYITSVDIIVPSFLLVIAYFRKKRGRSNESVSPS